MGIKKWEKWIGSRNARKISEIPLGQIVRNPFQPRREFDEKEIEELAASIENYGLIQPIVVREQGKGYQIIAGERRYRACHYLGLKEIPAIIEEMDDEQMAAVSLIENLQRRELNYFEEASAYSILINVFGMTQEEVARKVGKSQSAVANKMRLLKLSEPVRSYINTGTVSERHARALLRLQSGEAQMDVLQKIYEKDLTVKETEEMVERLRENLITPENKGRNNHQAVSIFIKDARIFVNTIKETVRRAKQTGVDMSMQEKEDEQNYEIVIRIAKRSRNMRALSP
jgi:ParB family chromosome partitioning protein